MLYKKINTVLTIGIVILATLASLIGIFSSDTVDVDQFVSIHGMTIDIHGKGIYKYMSADVAVQGIAQDYVTFFIGIPLLIFSLLQSRKNSLRGHLLFTGTLSYFFITYLFYMAMGMYNELFLVYVMLLGLTFFSLLLSLLAIDIQDLHHHFEPGLLNSVVGTFLIINSILITMMWLAIVLPPLLDGSIYPDALEHYTTLIVQGFDLGILLPLSFIAGLLLIKRKNIGFLSATVYMVFLSILMTALSAKVIAMKMDAVNVIPAIYIIPTLNILTIVLTFLLLNNIKDKEMKINFLRSSIAN